jgi:hypothetical protein
LQKGDEQARKWLVNSAIPRQERQHASGWRRAMGKVNRRKDSWIAETIDLQH